MLYDRVEPEFVGSYVSTVGDYDVAAAAAADPITRWSAHAQDAGDFTR